ncbi:hypothetical protein I2483_06030 [Sporosarcina sp. E16_3]|uniref:hypothetical protein n=1 Tax=Sporosarcina sp. E16_3 TaxID=2789293 RepID=UPI001A925AFD|nr:hypothetical protein [Sporosarcina sp. E16_3]MBO0601212.1 hypothetical protein [Sporosarcina sp. E16_3]
MFLCRTHYIVLNDMIDLLDLSERHYAKKMDFKKLFITFTSSATMTMMAVKATRENDCGYVDKLLIVEQADFLPIYV